MITEAKIRKMTGNQLVVVMDEEAAKFFKKAHPSKIEIRVDDGRSISSIQRRKIFAIIRDIALWSGHEPEYLRWMMTWDFCAKQDIEYFSLSTTDMTTARLFINYLIDFCLEWSVPTKQSLRENADDIDRYLYLCLAHRRCACCNMPADIHHVQRVGMGRDRTEISHVGMLAVALCRKHHQEAHSGEKAFFEKHHIYGIPLDENLCEKLNLPK